MKYQIKILDHQNPDDSGKPEEAVFFQDFPEGTSNQIITLALRGLLWEAGFVCENTETFISEVNS